MSSGALALHSGEIVSVTCVKPDPHKLQPLTEMIAKKRPAIPF